MGSRRRRNVVHIWHTYCPRSLAPSSLCIVRRSVSHIVHGDVAAATTTTTIMNNNWSHENESGQVEFKHEYAVTGVCVCVCVRASACIECDAWFWFSHVDDVPWPTAHSWRSTVNFHRYSHAQYEQNEEKNQQKVLFLVTHLPKSEWSRWVDYIPCFFFHFVFCSCCMLRV